MKASQISTRNRKSKPIIKSLAALAILTFFVAGPADARCRKPLKQRLTARHANAQEFGRAPVDARGIYLIAPVAPHGDYADHVSTRRGQVHRPHIRGLEPVHGETIYNIGDTDYDRRKEERREQRRRIIEGLKDAGVIREPGQPATTTTTQSGNNTGSTTTKPKPKPTPKPVVKPTRKPQPKVTKLPNGDQITEYPDGLRVVKLKDGSTVSTYPNGKRVVTNSKGDTTVTEPGGYRKTTNRYGDGTAHFADGTRIDFKASGEATLTRPDGKKFHRMPGKGFKEVD